MMNHTPIVEKLESRNLFAVASGILTATPAMIYEDLSASDRPQAVAKPQVATKPAKDAVAAVAAKKKKPPAKAPSLLGEWDGEWERKHWPFRLEYDIDLEFHSISKDTKTAWGTLDIEGDDYSGRWTGITYSKTGDFKYTLKLHGDKITIEGNIAPNSKFASGKLTIDWDHGGKSKGDLTLNKW